MKLNCGRTITKSWILMLKVEDSWKCKNIIFAFPGNESGKWYKTKEKYSQHLDKICRGNSRYADTNLENGMERGCVWLNAGRQEWDWWNKTGKDVMTWSIIICCLSQRHLQEVGSEVRSSLILYLLIGEVGFPRGSLMCSTTVPTPTTLTLKKNN